MKLAKTKVCPACKRALDFQANFIRSTGTERFYCASCEKAQAKANSRKHYLKNRERLLETVKLKRAQDLEYREEQNSSLRKRMSGPVPYTSALVEQLKKYDEVREAGDSKLEVRCSYCGKWFKPSKYQVKGRLEAVYGKMSPGAESRLYCSEGCKGACPVYYKKLFSAFETSEKQGTREVNSFLRKTVLQRDNFTCQICGKETEGLHCHHINPKNQFAIESADVDNCITLCKVCHDKVHHLPGCKYAELSCVNF